MTATNAGGTSAATNVNVNWQAAASAGLQMPNPVGFGMQVVGATTAPLAATITNPGGTAVTITSVSNDNDAEFPITANTCTGAVSPGAGCQITFTFRPASAGTRSATISVFTAAAQRRSSSSYSAPARQLPAARTTPACTGIHLVAPKTAGA